MGYCWGEHVGELELRVEAATERDVFADAVYAFGELLSEDGERSGPPARCRFAVTARDRAGLLAAFLDELIYFGETAGFVPGAVEELVLTDGSLEVLVAGHTGDPPHLVKAVTRHALAFERTQDGWRANVLLDV